MTTIKVKFQGLNYSFLKKISFTKEFETELEFIDIITDNKKFFKDERVIDYIGIESKYTVEQQADDYISDLDKSNLLTEYELSCIIDWDIISVECSGKIQYKRDKKKAKETLMTIFKQISDEDFKESDSELKNLFIELFKDKKQIFYDFVAAYNVQYDTIKKISFETQVYIVLNSINIGYDASTLILKRLNDDISTMKNEFEQRALYKEKKAIMFLNAKGIFC